MSNFSMKNYCCSDFQNILHLQTCENHLNISHIAKAETKSFFILTFCSYYICYKIDTLQLITIKITTN